MENLVTHCEQLGVNSVQWFNIFTNIIFFLFAFLFFHSVRNKSRLKKTDRIMIFSLLFIGLGSFFWHIFPALWTNYLDIGSIVVFSLIIITLIANKITNNFNLKLVFLAAIFFIGIFLKQLPYFNNSLAYIFLMILLFIMAFGLNVINKTKARILFRRAFLLFSLGFLAQKLDLFVCDFLVTGSHFIWHIFMAWVGYYLVKGVHVLYDNDSENMI